jgi:uncharacterized membrane protein YsdA (DUF1294 family)
MPWTSRRRGAASGARLRHKTVKQPFRQMFWCTIAVNVAAFLWLARFV